MLWTILIGKKSRNPKIDETDRNFYEQRMKITIYWKNTLKTSNIHISEIGISKIGFSRLKLFVLNQTLRIYFELFGDDHCFKDIELKSVFIFK